MNPLTIHEVLHLGTTQKSRLEGLTMWIWGGQGNMAGRLPLRTVSFWDLVVDEVERWLKVG